VHRDLVASMSITLRTLVPGDMKEAHEGIVELLWVDEETFIRFCEFAYTGDYKSAAPETVQVNNDEGANKPMQPGSDLQSPTVSKRRITDKKISRDVFAVPGFKLCSNTAAAVPRIPGMSFTDPVLVDHTSESKSCAGVFLCHAKVYVVADYYGIPSLARLSLQKLYHALGSCRPSGPRIQDIVELIKYGFKNTPNKPKDTELLRCLLCSYVACAIKELWQNREFQDLFTDPEMVDLWKAVIEHLLPRLV
jgi:hypothetical protein